MLIAHISDIHYPAGIHSLHGKRWLGAFNLLFNPLRSFDSSVFPPLLTFLRNSGVDHIIITGDVASLALEEEYEQVRLAFEEARIPPSKVTIVPGNHDTYVPSAMEDETFWKVLGPYARSAGPDDYPLVTEIGVGGLVTIGLSSAVTSPCAMSYGVLGTRQLERLDDLLARYDGYTRIVALHHSPVHGLVCDGLQDSVALMDILRKRGAELLFHGHIHHTEVHHIDLGPGRGQLPVMSVSPALLKQKTAGKMPTIRMIDVHQGHIEHWLVKWSDRFREWRPER